MKRLNPSRRGRSFQGGTIYPGLDEDSSVSTPPGEGGHFKSPSRCLYRMGSRGSQPLPAREVISRRDSMWDNMWGYFGSQPLPAREVISREIPKQTR